MQSKKPPRKKRGEYIPHKPVEEANTCMVSGCMEPGTYKAPRSRDELHDYNWYCLDHIREYNKQWDYFAGLDADDIEYFVRDAVTGHRPTWDRENRERKAHEHYFKLHDALYEFLSGGPGKPVAPPEPPLSGVLRKALATMDIQYPFTEQELKSQYRNMVKKYHPDLNKGDKKYEETFKQITVAYHQLSEHLKNA